MRENRTLIEHSMKPIELIRYIFFVIIVPTAMLVFNGLLAWLYPKLLPNGYVASFVASGIVGLLLYISAKILQLIQTTPGS